MLKSMTRCSIGQLMLNDVGHFARRHRSVHRVDAIANGQTDVSNTRAMDPSTVDLSPDARRGQKSTHRGDHAPFQNLTGG